MRLRPLYLALCILGAVLPYSQFLPWLRAHGVDVPLFFRELFANRVAGAFALDAILTAVVVSVFIVMEGRRPGLASLWLPVTLVFLVGISCGLPPSSTGARVRWSVPRFIDPDPVLTTSGPG